MEIEDLKKIPIPDYLKERGIEPVKKTKGGYFVYHAFWRGGDGNHIWVNTKENLWHDKVTGNGGSVIDLVKEIEGCTFHDACIKLGGKPVPTHYDFSQPIETNDESNIVLKGVRPVQLKPLFDYMRSRGITDATTKYYCKEEFFNYKDSTKRDLYAIGFPTDTEKSFALNGQTATRKIKMAIGHQDITTLKCPITETTEWMVFEGFIDFLSSGEMWALPRKYNAIVLNSTTNMNKAVSALKDATVVHYMGDNDEGGTNALKTLMGAFGDKVIDERKCFAPYKDVNDYYLQSWLPNHDGMFERIKMEGKK